MFIHRVLHSTIVPVRYPESDSLLYIDIVQFHLTQPKSARELVDELETKYAELSDGDKALGDRLIFGEAAFSAIAEKYHGTWKYLISDAHCAEFN